MTQPNEKDNTNDALYSFDLFGLFQAEEPIIHTEESIGNISKIKRIKLLNEGRSVSLPALSGNSFRGQMRDLIADHFVEMLRDNGKKVCMTPDIYSLIFSGGLMKEGSDISSKMNDLIQKVPLLSIWGSAFGNVMLPSKISVSHLIPLTEESQVILEERINKFKNLGSMDSHVLVKRLNNLEDNLPMSEDITFEEGPLTRKDDSKNPLLTKDISFNGTPSESKQQMIYHVECIACGTLLLQRIASKFPLSEIELGCLLDGLIEFSRFPAVGGRSAAGYGRVNFVYRLILKTSKGKTEDCWLDIDKLADLERDEEICEGILSRALKSYRDFVKDKRAGILKALGN